MPADNKRFGEIGVEVITRIALCPLTVGVSPYFSAVDPQLSQAADRYQQAVGDTSN
jgi:hypothetical protein